MLKRLGRNIKRYSYNCSYCGSTISGSDYERYGGKCWRCAKSYDAF